MDVRSTEAAVRRGGLGERVTLPAFVACLLLHSDGVTTSLLERTPVDGFADRLVRRTFQTTGIIRASFPFLSECSCVCLHPIYSGY